MTNEFDMTSGDWVAVEPESTDRVHHEAHDSATPRLQLQLVEATQSTTHPFSSAIIAACDIEGLLQD